MNKRAVSVFILLLTSVVNAAGESKFQKRFDEAVLKKDETQLEKVVADWKTAEPQNPQVYISAANYYFNMARREHLQISTKPPEGDDFVLTDSKTNNVAGSLSTVVDYDAVTAKRSVDALLEATRKFPYRLDIWFGLAHINQELGDFDAQFAVLTDAFKYATSHPETLKWTHGDPLPKAPADYIPETAHGYVTFYYNRQTPEDDERFLRVARLLAASYPKHPIPQNDIALYYCIKELWSLALPYLEKAHELDPADSLVTMNLGTIYAKLNDKVKARIYFEKVAASNADEEMRNAARQKLAELK